MGSISGQNKIPKWFVYYFVKARLYDTLFAIAQNSLNNNNSVYALDPLIMPFLSRTRSRNEKNRFWLTLFCEVFGHQYATQVTICLALVIVYLGYIVRAQFWQITFQTPTPPTEIEEVGKKNVNLSDMIYNIPLELIYMRNMTKKSSIIVFWCFQSTLLTEKSFLFVHIQVRHSHVSVTYWLSKCLQPAVLGYFHSFMIRGLYKIKKSCQLQM